MHLINYVKSMFIKSNRVLNLIITLTHWFSSYFNSICSIELLLINESKWYLNVLYIKPIDFFSFCLFEPGKIMIINYTKQLQWIAKIIFAMI